MRAFVYGTLKKGYVNHRLLEKSQFVGNGEIKGFSIYDLGPYPAIVDSKDAGEVVAGELYEIDEKTLVMLDRLEGEGFLYKRRQVNVLVGESELDAYVYVFLRDLRNAKKIEKEWRPLRC